MIAGEGGDDSGAQAVGLGMRQLQCRDLFQMVIQEPRVVDQGLQNQRFAAGQCAALSTHDRAVRKVRTGNLVGLAVDGLAAGRALRTAAARLRPARRARREGPPRWKTPA